MSTIKLSHMLAKVPSASIKITNISFELYDLLGWALVEGELCVGSDATETLVSITIPVQVSAKEVAELFDLKTNLKTSRRRNLK